MLTPIEENPEFEISVIVYGDTFVPENLSIKETHCQCIAIFKIRLDNNRCKTTKSVHRALVDGICNFRERDVCVKSRAGG